MNIKGKMFYHKIFELHLNTDIIGRNIKYFESAESTNQEAWKLIKENITDGTITVTKQQINGIGRRGDKWFSVPYKSLTFSIILNSKINSINRKLLSLISESSIFVCRL